MIVISRSLVLSATAPALGLNNPLFGWHNVVTRAAITADTENANYPASNLGNPYTHLGWRAADDAEQYLTFDISYLDPIDYLALARHNLGSAAIPHSVETYDGAEWNEIVPQRIVADDAPLLYRFPAASQSRIRLRLQSGSAPARIAVVYIGKLLVGQRRIYVGHSPITMANDPNISNGVSESGNFLGRILIGETNATAVDLKNLTPAWLRTNIKPFLKAGKTLPFFFGWRPLDYPDEIGFCWLTNNPKPVNQRNNGMMSVSLNLAGIV